LPIAAHPVVVESAAMNVVVRLLTLMCAVSLICSGAAAYAQRPPAAAVQTPEAGTADEPPDPRGRPDEKFVKVPQRYYVWHDAEGWHLRTAAQQNIRKFHGTITLKGGTFNKLREIGLERRGKYADSSKVSADRTKIEFTIYTSSSFDGYDFTIKGDPDARVEFELHRGGRDFPKEIFVGGEGKHPSRVKFGFPAQPTGAQATGM
jgi:hypothetical protein